jgi:hypothetical protein
MKRILFLAVVTVAVFLITPKMYSQTKHLTLRFHVPFSFSVNNETFTPGDYEFKQQSVFLLKVANVKSNDSAYESVYPAQSRKEGNGQVRLVFHRYGSQHFLISWLRFPMDRASRPTISRHPQTRSNWHRQILESR